VAKIRTTVISPLILIMLIQVRHDLTKTWKLDFLWDLMKDATYRTKVRMREELLHQI
jgi:hypothetical protein